MNQLPNFLFFVTDQQQAQVVSPDHPCRTPHAQQLAAEGLSFRRCYTPTAHCCPSRATLFTGLYPSRHGIFNNVLNEQAINTELNPGIRTFGEELSDLGYNLAFFGKWHVCANENPSDRSWTEGAVSSVRGQRNGLTWEQWQEQVANEEDVPKSRQPGEIIRPGWGKYCLYGRAGERLEKSGLQSSTDYRVVSEGISALHNLAKKPEPWSLFIGVNGPHDPYVIPEPYASLYDPAKVELPASYHDSLEDKPRIYQRQRRQVWDQLSEEEVRQAIAHYWGYCTMLDDMLGSVLKELDNSGCVENTVVVFLSDHGDYAGAHGLFAKGVAAFDEAYHIPCIIRWPAGIVNQGRTVDKYVTLADIAPTILELAGQSVPGLSGRSLSPFFRNELVTDWTDAFYSQFNGVELYYSQRVVQTNRYKYVFNGFDFDELYDLIDDPHELRNISDQPDMQSVKGDLAKRMWQFAYKEKDGMHNSYITVGLAPYGPLGAFEGW